MELWIMDCKPLYYRVQLLWVMISMPSHHRMYVLAPNQMSASILSSPVGAEHQEGGDNTIQTFSKRRKRKKKGSSSDPFRKRGTKEASSSDSLKRKGKEWKNFKLFQRDKV
jgi:hypothetical protein